MSVQKSNVLVCWHHNGLDVIFDLTHWEKEYMWATLTGEKLPNGPNLRDLLHKAYWTRSTNLKYYMYSFMTELSELEMRSLWRKVKTRKELIKLIKTTGTNFLEKFYDSYHPNHKVFEK
jgi:hypothetical protein